MPEPEPQNSDLSRLQAALQRLTPRPANIDRDRVLYEAGRASARGSRWWPWATFGMTVLASCLAMALVLYSAADPIRHVVQVPAPHATPVAQRPAPLPDEAREILPPNAPDEAVAAQEVDEYSYLRMHQAAMQTGIEQALTPVAPKQPRRASPPQPIPTAGTRSYAATLEVTGDY